MDPDSFTFVLQDPDPHFLVLLDPDLQNKRTTDQKFKLSGIRSDSSWIRIRVLKIWDRITALSHPYLPETTYTEIENKTLFLQ